MRQNKKVRLNTYYVLTTGRISSPLWSHDRHCKSQVGGWERENEGGQNYGEEDG